MPKFCIKSLGCKTNQLEGQIMSDNLNSAGFTRVFSVSEADYYILNSCTVTASADSEVHYLLNKVKRENPNITRILCGCAVDAGIEYAENSAEICLENGRKMCIAEILQGKTDNDKDEFSHFFKKSLKTSRVGIKIQEGCNNSCSYCIIPQARGKSRSNSVQNIIKQIDDVVRFGREEVILTGIHIGEWGLEFDKHLIDLLKEIEKTEIKRYRLGSLYVNEIDDELIDFLSKSSKFCPHFHLSLQSMTDKTLKNMNRHYSVSEEFDVIKKIKDNFPYAFIGADIIVGFPQESDEDFLETLENIKKSKLSKVHVFPYSKRPNTKASLMEGQIEESIKKQRARDLIKISNNLKSDFISQNIGRTLDVIFENKIRKDAFVKGISENYIEVYVKDTKIEPNKIQKIMLKSENLKS